MVVMLYRRQLSWEVGNWLQSRTLVLQKYSTYRDFGGISLKDKQSVLGEVHYSQYRGIHQSCIQFVKWRLLSISPHPLILWSSQVSKGCSKVSIASYKLAIIIGKAKEFLNLFLGLRLRLLASSCFFFLRINTDTQYRYICTQGNIWSSSQKNTSTT